MISQDLLCNNPTMTPTDNIDLEFPSEHQNTLKSFMNTEEQKQKKLVSFNKMDKKVFEAFKHILPFIDKLQDLVRENERLKMELLESNTQIQSLQATNTTLQNTNQDLQTPNMILQNKNEELQTANVSLHDKLKNNEKETIEQKQENMKLLEDIVRLKKENAATSIGAKDCHSANVTIHHVDVGNMQRILNDTVQELIAKKEEVAKLTTKLRESEERNNELQNRINQMNHENNTDMGLSVPVNESNLGSV